MNILHLCYSACAGSPSHLSKIINKYTEHSSKSVLARTFSSSNQNKLYWDYDYLSPKAEELNSLIAWADIIHMHQRIYPVKIEKKPIIFQCHGHPCEITPQNHKEIKKFLVVAQYQTRFYPYTLVPNMIDIWDNMFMPIEKTEPIKLFFSYAGQVKGGWADKGIENTLAVFKKVKEKYGDKVTTEVLTNIPYKELIERKKNADIVIDSCSEFSKSYHLSSLEGCSLGAVTFNYMDNLTAQSMSKISDTTTNPFDVCHPNDLVYRICYYLDSIDVLRKKQKDARVWMEIFWDPKKLVNRFIDLYKEILNVK